MKKREIVLDLFVFDEDTNLLAVDRGENDVYETNVLSALILILPMGQHPVEYVKNYLSQKGLEVDFVELLPAIYHNTFDTMPNEEFLVLSFKVVVGHRDNINGDEENKNLVWMSINEFESHPKLMPEFRRSKVWKIFDGKSLFYKGHYKESDGSYDPINWQEV